MLNDLKNEIKELMLGPVYEIVSETRKGNMTIVEEKSDCDSAINADIQI